MIQHIKYFIIPLLVFISLSCQQSSKPSQEIKPENHKSIEKQSRNFVFYKSFGFCNSEVGYFSQQEADDLYDDKTITIDKKDEIKSDATSVFDEEKWKCLNENLNLKQNSNIKIIKTKDDFPFEKLVLIDDKYVIVSRDGYFFIFILKETIASVEKKSTNQQNFSPLFNVQLTGLSTINSKEQDIYKKYGLDFSTLCNCNSPSIYLNKESKELIIFNYCDNEKPFKDIKNKYLFKIDKLEVIDDEMIVSNDNLELSFQKLEDGKIYQMKILKGKFPNDFVGNDLKTFYTSQPEKFQKISCGDYDG